MNPYLKSKIRRKLRGQLRRIQVLDALARLRQRDMEFQYQPMDS